MNQPLQPRHLTLGILAGGRATRLGGLDKAWLQRDGVPQVLRWRRRFAAQVSAALVSANRDLERYREAGLDAVCDRKFDDAPNLMRVGPQRAAAAPDAPEADLGPIAGLDALARACSTSWLLTVPVDLVEVNDCLLPSLAAAGAQGAWAEDGDGPQPLVALWCVKSLRKAATMAIGTGDLAVYQLQGRLGMTGVRFAGVRFGNLNTPADLAAAGFDRHD